MSGRPVSPGRTSFKGFTGTRGGGGGSIKCTQVGIIYASVARNSRNLTSPDLSPHPNIDVIVDMNAKRDS